MKKDIEIPEVSDVYVAAVIDKSDAAQPTWNIQLINAKNTVLENIMITARGFLETEKGQELVSSTLRHRLAVLPTQSAAKIEIIDAQVFEIFNEYWVTFFCENKLYERKFTFGPHTIDERFLEDLPVLNQKGILVK